MREEQRFVAPVPNDPCSSIAAPGEAQPSGSLGEPWGLVWSITRSYNLTSSGSIVSCGS